MGAAGEIVALPVYQLALPITHESQRVMDLDYIPLLRRMTLSGRVAAYLHARHLDGAYRSSAA